MERKQVLPQQTSSGYQEVASNGVRGRAEFNVPDVKDEPISNTYHNSGWYLHRRMGRMMQELDITRPPNREVAGKPQIAHFTPAEKSLQRSMYRKSRL